MLLSWDKLLSFVEIVVAVVVVVLCFHLIFFHFISFKNGKVIVYCEWKSYLCTAHTPVPRLLNFKCHNASFRNLSITSIFNIFIWKGGGTEKFSWWLLSFNFVFILSLYAVRTSAVDGGWLRTRTHPCMCACLLVQVILNHFPIYFSEIFQWISPKYIH